MKKAQPKGLGAKGTSKTITLKRIISLFRPSVLALQESMMEGEKVKELLSSFLRDWKMEALNA